MGQFNATLLQDLAKTADLEGNNSATPTPGYQTGFDPTALAQIQRFKDAMFQLVMLRAYNFYVATGQDKEAEHKRFAMAEFQLRLNSETVHQTALAPNSTMQPKSTVAMLGTIPGLPMSIYDIVPGGHADIPILVDGFNGLRNPPENNFALACK